MGSGVSHTAEQLEDARDEARARAAALRPGTMRVFVKTLDGASAPVLCFEEETIATLKLRIHAQLGLSLWHENTRLYESGTLQSYGIGAGAEIQALMTEHDVKAALREEREAKEMDRAEAERKFGWEMNYGCCISKAEGERRRRKALEQARRALEPARQIARDLAQLGPAQLKAKYDTAANRKALYYAAAGGKTKDVRRYIRMGVDVDWILPGLGVTALIRAADHGHVVVVKLLLAAGAQVDHAENSGTTALWTAACGGHLDVVRVLLNAGADKTIAERPFGRKAIDVVCNTARRSDKIKHKDTITALLRGAVQAPAKVNPKPPQPTSLIASTSPAIVKKAVVSLSFTEQDIRRSLHLA